LGLASTEHDTEHDKVALDRRVHALQGQIDQLVYELYGLTEEEIRIVEPATGGRGGENLMGGCEELVRVRRS
jgi:hypothetical protein